MLSAPLKTVHELHLPPREKWDTCGSLIQAGMTEEAAKTLEWWQTHLKSPPGTACFLAWKETIKDRSLDLQKGMKSNPKTN